MDQALIDRIVLECDRTGAYRSEVARRALRLYLTQREAIHERTAAIEREFAGNGSPGRPGRKRERPEKEEK